MDREPLIARSEIEAAFWNSKAEHDAWEAHVDETLRRLRAAIESIRARDERAKAAEG